MRPSVRAAHQCSAGSQIVSIFVALLVAVFSTATAEATNGGLFPDGTVYNAATYSNHPSHWGNPSIEVVDINIGSGSADCDFPIRAPEGGGSVTVHSTGYGGGWGNSIIWTKGSESIFMAHLEDFGATGSVAGGDIIGYIGTTGQSTGCHLHIESSQGQLVLCGQAIVPEYWYNGPAYTSCGPIGGSGCDTEVGSGTTIIDNTSSCFAKYGPTNYWHDQYSGSYGTGSWWTYTTNESSPENYTKWTLDVKSAGNYEVSVYVPSSNATSAMAEYKIWHNGQASYETINQNNSSGWVVLGTYYFNVDDSQAIRLNDNTGEACCNKKIASDAVKLVKNASVNVSFIEALVDDAEVALQWKTNPTPQTAGWKVLRRAAGESVYESIGEIIPPGDASYELIDPQPEACEVNQYMVREISLNGDETDYGPAWAIPCGHDHDESGRIDGLDLIVHSALGNETAEEPQETGFAKLFGRILTSRPVVPGAGCSVDPTLGECGGQ